MFTKDMIVTTNQQKVVFKYWRVTEKKETKFSTVECVPIILNGPRESEQCLKTFLLKEHLTVWKPQKGELVEWYAFGKHKPQRFNRMLPNGQFVIGKDDLWINAKEIRPLK